MLCALAGIRQWDISIYENVIPFPFCTIFDHALKIGAVVVCACHGSVDIGVENKYIIPLRIFFANMELPLNGLFRLVFAGLTCIDNCCFHCSKLLKLLFLSFDGSDQNGNAISFPLT